MILFGHFDVKKVFVFNLIASLAIFHKQQMFPAETQPDCKSYLTSHLHSLKFCTNPEAGKTRALCTFVIILFIFSFCQSICFFELSLDFE